MAESHTQAKVQSGSKVTVVNIPDSIPGNDAPVLTYEQRKVASIIDFLRGIDRKEWTIELSSVIGHTLPTTGHPMSRRMMMDIRDELLKKGWAYWNSNNKKSGWSLSYPAGEILKKMGL